MLPKFDGGHAFLIATLILDAHVHRKNCRTINLLKEENYFLAKQIEKGGRQLDYLCELINEREMPVTEFEKIVLNNL